LLQAIPADGAAGVPTNAKLFAHYAPNASYLDEEVVLEHVGVGETTLKATWNAAESMLSVEPVLTAGAQYVVRWPRLRGLNTANLGRAEDVSFEVGTTSDEMPPQLEGIAKLEWDVDRERDDCTDNLEERYLFDFELGAASDDGGRDSLTLVLFQTKGPHVPADAPQPVLIQRLPAEGGTARLSTTIGDGVGDVCFAAIVRDLTGKVSASGSREICVETVEPPFFSGCSLGPRSRSTAGLLLLALALALGARRGRRR